MATSAETLTKILQTLGKKYDFKADDAITLLAPKGLLPKKLTETPKLKKVSQFASPQASDYASAHGIEIPDGYKGTAKDGKISVNDLKALSAPKKVKVNASPNALKFARTNGLDISKIKGSGVGGKILQKDVQELKPAAEAETAKRKISPKAAQLIKEYLIDEEDVESVKGTGVNGTIKECDIMPLCHDMKKKKKKRKTSGNETQSDSDESSDEDED